jgi:hypothetical protein
MKQKIITKFAFSKLCGVTASAMTKACKHALKGALVGNRIDLNSKTAKDYIKKKALQQTKKTEQNVNKKVHKKVKEKTGSSSGKVKTKKIISGKNAAKETKKKEAAKEALKNINDIEDPEIKEEDYSTIDIPEDIREFADWSLRKIIFHFGTDVRFLDFLKALKAIEEINEKQLKNAKTKGELVSRELIKVFVIDIFNACFIKMLSDGARTITTRTIAMVKAKRKQSDILDFVVDTIASFIKPAKVKAKRGLKNA